MLATRIIHSLLFALQWWPQDQMTIPSENIDIGYKQLLLQHQDHCHHINNGTSFAQGGSSFTSFYMHHFFYLATMCLWTGKYNQPFLILFKSDFDITNTQTLLVISSISCTSCYLFSYHVTNNEMWCNQPFLIFI